MKNLFIFFLLIGFQLQAQKRENISIFLLDNENIAEVNTSGDSFIRSFDNIIGLFEKEFSSLPSSQKITLFINFHKKGKPTIQLYSKPILATEKENSFLTQLIQLPLENTKLVNFPIAVTLNIKDERLEEIFPNIFDPLQQPITNYIEADIKKKIELNKEWAVNEVLPVLNAYQVIVDDKFTGVKGFGKTISTINFNEKQNIINLTDKNADYWRACMEMQAGNQLITATKVFILVAQGELDYANQYLDIVDMFSKSGNIPNRYLEELKKRMQLFSNQLNKEIQKGIEQHDKGNYQTAIDIYKNILSIYPKSAWALYELYYSQNALEVKENKMTMEDRSLWDKAKPEIYKANPLYPRDVRASNGKEGYLIFRRQELKTLFKKEDAQIDDIYKCAEIAMDLGAYDFAAQLFWYSTLYNKKLDTNKILYRFLYCLEKLGVKRMDNIFKIDFDKEFKKIDEEREKEMKKNIVYKSFKK
jgi:tetratricopeptide (TPR) repeat protein